MKKHKKRERERGRERGRERQTETETERDRDREGEADRQAGRQSESEWEKTETQRQAQTEREREKKKKKTEGKNPSTHAISPLSRSTGPELEQLGPYSKRGRDWSGCARFEPEPTGLPRDDFLSSFNLITAPLSNKCRLERPRLHREQAIDRGTFGLLCFATRTLPNTYVTSMSASI